MRIFLSAVAASILALSLSEPSAAGWQATGWGMSADQVKASMGSAVQADIACPGAQDANRFAMHMIYMMGIFKFSACLSGGKATGLDSVDLALLPTAENVSVLAGSLKDELMSKYGVPFSVSPFAGLTATEWHHGNDKIVLKAGVFVDGKYVALLDYFPLSAGNNK